MKLWQIKLGFREPGEIEFELEASDDREGVLKLINQFVKEEFWTHVDIQESEG
jgi:hypothetical protein